MFDRFFVFVFLSQTNERKFIFSVPSFPRRRESPSSDVDYSLRINAKVDTDCSLGFID